MRYHPDYGLPDSLRVACVESVKLIGVKETANKFNVSTSSVYRWRNEIEKEIKWLTTDGPTMKRGLSIFGLEIVPLSILPTKR